tara:strand:+ start:5836 stop:6114 length:279 start_codon:yes stop_codon:yes gene_type:complete
MKPFAVFEGTTDEDGKFSKFDIPGKRRHRFRVVMWIKTNNDTRLEHDFSTKQPCRFTDFMTQIVKPAVDEIIAEAAQHGGTKRYGFSCFKWG